MRPTSRCCGAPSSAHAFTGLPVWVRERPDGTTAYGAPPAAGPDDPDASSVAVACGFSGHGSTLTPVLGEVLADLATDGTTAYDLSLLSPLRRPAR